MSKIPIVDYDIVHESYEKILKHDFQNMSEVEFENFMIKWDNIFKTRQPHIHEYTNRLMENHMEHTNGVILVQQLAIYIMILLDSIYSQQETDEIRRLFEDNDE